MEKKITFLKRFSSFKIVLIYAVLSAIYIFTSDYFLELIFKEVHLISKFQTVKGIVFIAITSLLLHTLMKRNIDKLSNYYRQIIEFKLGTEKLTKQSKQEYIDLFNHSPIPMWIFDTTTLKFLLVNDTACHHYGFSQEEYATMTIKDIRPLEDIPHLEKLLSYSLLTDTSLTDVLRHQKKNGEIIYVKIKTTWVNFEGKKARLASSVDITSELKYQKEIEETNKRLNIACEIANMGYWSNDLLTNEIIWSDEMHKIFETNPEKFLLTIENIKNRFHPDDQYKIDVETFFNFDINEIIESEQRIITDSGKMKWILERIHLIRDANNLPIRLEGVAVDITKRKLHEQEIAESNERFKMLAKATFEAIIDRDNVNDTIFFGEGFQTMFGYNIDKPSKYLWRKNLHPEDKIKVIRSLNKAIKNPKQEFFNTEYRFIKANGDVAYIQHKGIFIRNCNGEVTRIIGAMVDITEALEKIQKIEMQDKALKDISWTQSHVVRAPLANLIGLIDLLKENRKMGLIDDRLVDYISESADRLDHVIHDIVKKTSETNP